MTEPSASAAPTPLWVSEADGTWIARNGFLRYTAVAPTLHELRDVVSESAKAEGWPGWVFHYASEPEPTR